jgi:hypothetical protein
VFATEAPVTTVQFAPPAQPASVSSRPVSPVPVRAASAGDPLTPVIIYALPLRCFPYPEGTAHPIPIAERASPEQRKEYEVFNAGQERLRAEEEALHHNDCKPEPYVGVEVVEATTGRHVNVGGKAYIAFDVRSVVTGQDFGRCDTVLFQACEVIPVVQLQREELRATLWFVPAHTGYEGASAEVPVVMG